MIYKICKSDSKISVGRRNFKRSKTNKRRRSSSTTTMMKSKSWKIYTARN